MKQRYALLDIQHLFSFFVAILVRICGYFFYLVPIFVNLCHFKVWLHPAGYHFNDSSHVELAIGLFIEAVGTLLKDLSESLMIKSRF